MRKDTSGLMFTQNRDGSIMIEVVDYAVEEFGGDWESRHVLDKLNAKKLFAELKKLHDGSFEEMLIKEFEKSFNILKFEKFCKDHQIDYSLTTWY